ncbi:putative ribonuclease H-like domain-containing protein [Tanacetum coccineum]
MTHLHPNRKFVLQAVLTRSGKINTTGASVNTEVRPVNTAGSKPTMNYPRPISNAYKKGYSQVTRPFKKYSANKNSIFNKKVNTARVKDTTARDRAAGNPQQKEYKGKLPCKVFAQDFENDYSCVCMSGESYHKASYKAKLVNSISKPLHMLHMDLFGPTNVKSLMKKSYCLVVTDDFSRFSWVFFFATKDETSGILKTFITKIENQLDYKVKVIRCDNGTEFKNSVMNQFCEMKGIKREFSVARTPQQNGVAERRNRTLIEAARTMLVDSKLPTTFWAEAVNTACYVLNRILIPGKRDNIVEGQAEKKIEPEQDEASDKDGKDEQVTRNEFERLLQQEKQTEHPNNTNSINTVSTLVSTAGPSFTYDDQSSPVNAAEASNAFEDHLFDRFSLFKNAFTLPDVPNVTPMDDI